MKSRFLTYCLLLFLIVQFSCSDSKRPAKGSFFQVLVVMDSTQFQSPLADSIRRSFGGDIMTLPAPEPRYDLSFFSIKTAKDLEFAKNAKNVIFASPVDGGGITAQIIESFVDPQVWEKFGNDELHAIPLKDRWASNQWALILSGSSQETTAAFLSKDQHYLVDQLDVKERERWLPEILKKGRQKQFEDSLWNAFGWKVGIQHDYIHHIDQIGFVTFRRYLKNNDRWFWVWWKDNISNLDFLSPEWINQTRDSLMEKYIRGTRPDSYIQTEYRRTIESSIKEMNGKYTIQTNGTWRMENDLMGGPFVNYTFYDEQQNRLYMLEYGQFAPKYPKRTFVRQFEALALSFKTDALFKSYPDSVQEEKK